MSTNRAAQRIPQSVVDQSKALFLELKTLWEPYFISLTEDEQDGLVKMADRKLPFALEVQQTASVLPDFVPAFVDTEAFQVDMDNSKNLQPVLAMGRTWVRELEVLQLVSNSEAYDAALSIYAGIREAANRQGDSRARAAADSLGRHFKRGSYRKKTQETTNS